MKIAVIDAHGGGLGKAIIERIKSCSVLSNTQIFALGTNAAATAVMKKAGADYVATGENAICFNANKVDLIIGGIGIIAANSMLGEISPRMANAIASSSAKKILIPTSKCNITIPGTSDISLNELLDKAIQLIIK